MDVSQSPGLVVGVLGLGMLQIVSLYEGTAPSVKELRESPVGDVTNREALMDADILVGGATAIVIIVATVATKSSLPLLLFGGGLAFVSFWHHLVLNTPNTQQR